MPLYRPSDTVGAAWVTFCLDQAHIEPQQNVSNRDFILFKGKLQKNHAVIRDIFSVNSDKKNHDPDR